MAFINEYVSEADVARYGLDEFMKSWRGGSFGWRNGRPSIFKHSWTVDRDRDAYLLCMGMISEVGQSGRPEPRPATWFVLFLRGVPYSVLLEPFESGTNPQGHPYRKVWVLMDFEGPRDGGEARDDVPSVLKEALVVYGARGIWREAPGMIIDFKF